MPPASPVHDHKHRENVMQMNNDRVVVYTIMWYFNEAEVGVIGLADSYYRIVE